MKRYTLHFALGFAILIVFAGAGMAAFVKVLTTDYATKPQVKKIERAVSPTEALIVQTACAYIGQAASQQGLLTRKCEKKSIKTQGNQALVVLKQETDQGTFTVTVHLQRAGWNPDGMQVA